MPLKPPRICACGHCVPADQRCACQRRRDLERKMRFDRTRPSARARGYDADWQKARAEFLRENPTCRRCPAPATVVDHIMPHKGNQRLFWNRANWQPLCGHCHNSIKQSEERTAK